MDLLIHQLKIILEINKNAKQLDKENSEIFHSMTEKLLFLTKIARPDIETAVSYFTKRVTKSDEYDWKKILRLLVCIINTICGKSIIGASIFKGVYTCIDE